ncbi:MAG: hypothetical protein ACTSPY_08480 [Candidatus Helarchaeota archaeon]
MKIYITSLGRSAWSVINSYYSVVKYAKYSPDSIYIIIEDLFQDKIDDIKKGLCIISEEFDFNPEFKLFFVKESAFSDIRNKINSIITDLENSDNTIAIDITSGRKILIINILLLIFQSSIKIDHLFYLAIKTIKDVNMPYEMIPKQFHSLRDLIREINDVKSEK